MSMLLAATDLGIASGHSGCEDQALARSVMDLGDDDECFHLLVLGHPEKPLRPIEHPDRRPFDEVVHWPR
jgi:hypothetical protein